MRKPNSLFLILILLFSIKNPPAAGTDKKTALKKPVDFAIVKAFSESCACELKGLDVEYFNKIIVRVANKSGIAEDVEIIVGYYDSLLMARRTVIEKIKDLKPGETRTVAVIKRPILAQKSSGVLIAVTPVYPAFVEDKNQDNNRIYIYKCISE